MCFRSSSFSSPPPRFFDILFVSGHEAVCAVAIEPPPPIPRPHCRPLDLSHTFPHPSACDSRASRVARGRDGGAPHVQGSWVGWVDDVGRASGRLRSHPPRRRRLESHWLEDGPQRPAHGWPSRIRRLRPATTSPRSSSEAKIANASVSQDLCAARFACDLQMGH